MTYRTILQHPNPVLRKKSTSVDFSAESENLEKIVSDLIDTIEIHNGAGLAAPQIGYRKRVLTLNPESFSVENPDPFPGREKYMVLVNPTLELSEEKISWPESCLSVPFGRATISRSKDCKVSYQTLQGEEKTIELTWPLSAVLQHEYDHLEGKLYIDYLSHFSREMITKKILKYNKKKQRLAEQKKEEEIFDLYGPEALRRYRDQKSGKTASLSEKKKQRKKKQKTFGKNKRKNRRKKK